MANTSQSRSARRKQLKQQKKQKKSLFKKIVKTLLIVVLLIGIGIGGLFTYYIATAPKLDAESLAVPASTKLLDVNGEEFANLGEEKRTKIDYEDLPPLLVDAVTATEDSRFFDHIGIDFRRIGGAILANITGGFGAEGASTIDQQVIKGAFLTPEKTLKRKVQEQWLALRLDAKYSKEEILEMYLNRIYYGNVYGVAEAADFYFGKEDLSELTLPEAAVLAGLPQRPSAYDPTRNPELTQERMNTVLSLMVQHGKISQEEADQASEVSVDSLLVESKQETTPYQAFIQQVQDEVSEKLDADIYNDGLEIQTTLDPEAQKHVEFLLSEDDSNPISYPNDEFRAGMTVLDTTSGAIRAIGGGRNLDNTQGGWNYAIDNENRQAGSTFKPIIDYGPAIEYEQWSTYHQINDDGRYHIAGTDSYIDNWNGQHNGWMSARSALAQSLNVPAVKTFEEIGAERAQEFAEGLGIRFNEGSIALTDAIGGSSTGVTTLQMAGAYSAFGNKGIYNEPYAVTKVTYSDGRTVDLKPEPKSAMHEYTAYMITDMLKSVVNDPSGTGTAAKVPGLPMAGKTGTTNLEGKEGSPDSWFSGYTTNYTIAVWTGYDDQKETLNGHSETVIAQDLFRETMSYLSEGIDTADFTKPDSVVEVQVEKGSNPAKLPSEYTPQSNIVTELFVKGNEPSKTSQKFDRIDAVSGLKASFNEESQSIDISWNYDQDDDRPVTFNVKAGTDDGSLKDLADTKDTSLEISNVDLGTTYTIQVTAVSDQDSGNTSDPATVTVQVADDEADKEEEQQDEEENQEENPEDNENPGDGNGNGNGNGNDNNQGDNGNGNGNGNEGGNGEGNGNGAGDDNGNGGNNDNDNGETDNEDETPGDEPVDDEEPTGDTGDPEANASSSESASSYLLHAIREEEIA
ncbi:PBP1A family penicillin-binding protein [Sediminibacillus dalangtanensis]|uniref:PBP1A family penicillin-binding protein n=1 Tax=Sediminibacillus dalangtanensis TaxID=2729421 RepID=A0ABX7VUE0_9BACI|nr:penicillin-binding protein 1A [Sediminibacillus dalangtanensis]QTM99624.1 PBP1A family penicillin-binding protein [Sediminibacillus dalangtanensis]